MVMKTIIQAILVKDGTETCTVGFLPRHVIHKGKTTINRFMGKFAQIIELYDLCNDSKEEKKEFQESRHGITLYAKWHSRGGVECSILVVKDLF